MASKINLLALLLLLSLLASGCQLLSSEKSEGIPDFSSAFEGADGLVISFFEGAPPDSLFPGASTHIALLLENKGAVSISCTETADNPGGCGKFLVFSKPPLSISVQDGLQKAVVESDNLLIGKESYASGGRAAIAIPREGDKPFIVGQPSKTTTALVFAVACYPYETKLSTPVCIPTAPFTVQKEQRVCNLEDLSFRSQGAPVAITKIVQNEFVTEENGAEIVKPHLRVFVENAGKGTVIERSANSFRDACTSESVTGKDASIPAQETAILGKISVKSAEVSGIRMVCNDGLDLKLTGDAKKDFFDCTAASGKSFPKENYANNFVATFNLVLSYGYQSAASKEVRIEVPER